MQKDETYHTSAIQYNDELAEFAHGLADRLEHPTISGWSQSVSKQHKFHAGRHRKALAKLESEENTTADTEDGGEDRIVEESISDQQRRYAEDQPPSTGVDTPAEPDPNQAAEPVSNQGERI